MDIYIYKFNLAVKAILNMIHMVLLEMVLETKVKDCALKVSMPITISSYGQQWALVLQQ